MKTHRLKVWHQYWDAVASGEKNFEVRRDDRGFQKGDILELVRAISYSNMSSPVQAGQSVSETGDSVRREITYILTGGQFGVEPGHVVLGLKALPQEGKTK